MRKRSLLLVVAMLSLLIAGAPRDAFAGGCHRWWRGPRVAIGIGPAWWWRPRVVVGAPVAAVVVRPAPAVVAPRPIYPQPPAPVAASSWYYCASSGSYYPNVATCAEPWVAVPVR